MRTLTRCGTVLSVILMVGMPQTSIGQTFAERAAAIALAQREPKPNLLRIACEEINFRGRGLGKALIIQQLSYEDSNGSDILRDGQGGKSAVVDYTLTVFEAGLDFEGDIAGQAASIIQSAPVLRDSVLGDGDILGNSFAFRSNLADRIRFRLAFTNLDSGSFFLNSRVDSTRFECAFPFVVSPG